MILPTCVLIAGCGGGGSGLEPAQPRTIGTVAFAIPAEGAASPLDLDDPVLIAASALSVVSAGSAFDAVLGSDFGSDPPGDGVVRCDSGQYTDAVSVTGATRTFRLDYEQCSFEGVDGDELFDGPIRLIRTPTATGGEGTAEAGIGNDRLRGASREAGDDDFDFLQLEALIDFETAANRAAMNLRGARYIGGEADLVSGQPLVPRIFAEVLAGLAGTDLLLFIEREAGAREYAAEGPVSIRASGTSAGCALPASRFTVATNTPVRIEFDGDDSRLVAGVLTLSTPTQNASVQFNADLSLTVTPDRGPARVFARGEVDAFCGFSNAS